MSRSSLDTVHPFFEQNNRLSQKIWALVLSEGETMIPGTLIHWMLTHPRGIEYCMMGFYYKSEISNFFLTCASKEFGEKWMIPFLESSNSYII